MQKDKVCKIVEGALVEKDTGAMDPFGKTVPIERGMGMSP